MWPFTRHYSLNEIGFLSGAVDYHCHILPGVDDGVRSLEKSLAALSFYEEAGVSEVWLTPHIMEDCPNETRELREAFEQLCAAYHGPLVMHLAAENMLDALFEQRFCEGDLLTMGEGSHLLIETSYFNPPMGLYDLLDDIRSHGFFPVLAHPERYIYMTPADYDRLKGMGVQFQLSTMSLTGMYGLEPAVKARHLLHEGMYNFYGSDLHHLSLFRNSLSAKVLSCKEVDALLELKQNACFGAGEPLRGRFAWNVR